MRKLFEVYFMNDEPLREEEQSVVNGWIGEVIEQYDVVIVTDFGHGLVHGATVDLLTSHSPFLAVNTQANSANYGFNTVTKYPRADYVCIDGPEARLAIKDKFADIDEIAVSELPKVIECSNIVVTKGARGCVTWDGSSVGNVPVLAPTVVDTVGAGDAFFVVTAPLVASGMPMPLVGFVGNLAGGLKVGIVGHRTSIEKRALVEFANQLLA
jgi:sugar/nucleoside kinase (ribokinase family)